jgi:hypothetical protein
VLNLEVLVGGERVVRGWDSQNFDKVSIHKVSKFGSPAKIGKMRVSGSARVRGNGQRGVGGDMKIIRGENWELVGVWGKWSDMKL